jgi:large subunit ribosomal protein L28
MSQVCQITGKKNMVGHKISHSNRKTKRRFMPNLQWHRFWFAEEKRFVRLFVSSKGLRIVDKAGVAEVVAMLRSQGQKV